MKRFFPVFFLAGASLMAQAPGERSAHFMLNLTYTNGGDNLVHATYTDGSTSSVKAGGETLFKLGLDYQINPRFSFQTTFGYHTASTKEAENGSAKFSRTALEGQVHWHPHEHFRVGLGLRQASGAKLSGSGAGASVGDIEFDASLGKILEVEYLTSKVPFGRGGVSLRFVSEDYTVTKYNGMPMSGASSIDGSHFGIGFSWYF